MPGRDTDSLWLCSPQRYRQCPRESERARAKVERVAEVSLVEPRRKVPKKKTGVGSIQGDGATIIRSANRWGLTKETEMF